MKKLSKERLAQLEQGGAKVLRKKKAPEPESPEQTLVSSMREVVNESRKMVSDVAAIASKVQEISTTPQVIETQAPASPVKTVKVSNIQRDKEGRIMSCNLDVEREAVH